MGSMESAPRRRSRRITPFVELTLAEQQAVSPCLNVLKELPISMSWHAKTEGGDVLHSVDVELFKAVTEEESCGVFHDSIMEIDMNPLPSTWAPGLTGARLPCNHTFHVSALAMHFLTHNMTCPVCRAGNSTVKMHESSLPLNVQASFAENLKSFNERNPIEQHAELGNEIVFESRLVNRTLLGQQFMLQMRFECESGFSMNNIPGGWFGSMRSETRNIHIVTLATRIMGLDPGSDDSPPSTAASGTLQHNFLRRLESLRINAGSSARVQCVITHPCIPHGIYIQNGVEGFSDTTPGAPGAQNFVMRNAPSFMSGVPLGHIDFDLSPATDTHHEQMKLQVAGFRVELNMDMLMQLCLAHIAEVFDTITGGAFVQQFPSVITH